MTSPETKKTKRIDVTTLLEKYSDIGRLALMQLLMMPTVIYVCLIVQDALIS